MPRFDIEGRLVILDPLQCQAAPRHLPNDPVASLADESATRIIVAMDEVLTRAHR